MSGYVTDVSYTIRFQRELAPAWLDTVAVVCGVQPPDRSRGFSWCDLGCGPGLSAVVLAASHPAGRFVGIDLMPEHVAHARRLAADAGVTNLTLHQADFTSADPGKVTFDYITAHGVYAWVDTAARAALRRFVDRHLAPGGLLYLSYNAMPGWAADLPMQRLILQLGRDAPGDSIARFAAAAGLVGPVATAGAPSLAASPLTGQLGDMQVRHPSAYLAHEYMAEHWQPLFVTEVRRDMAEIGLAPVGSATFADNFDSFSLRKIEREALEAFDDPDTRELVRDYLMHQRFRRDVFSRAAPPLDEGERRDRLFATRYALAQPAGLVEFATRTPAGRLTFDTPAARAVVSGLGNGPQRLADIDPAGESPRDLLADLLAFCCAGAVRPVADDADVSSLNRTILSRLGGPGQIDYLALSCGTAVTVAPTLLRELRDGAPPADAAAKQWHNYLAAYAYL